MNQAVYIIKGSLLVLLIISGSMVVKGIAGAEQVKEEKGPLINHDPVPKADNGKSMQYSAGKRLFQVMCASCHSLFKDQTGPSLAYMIDSEQWSDREKLYQWIRNPSAFMKKDAYTRSLVEKFGGTVMTAFPNLTNDEIDAIVGYIITARKPGPVY